jgi:hypothetical protein
LAIETGTSLRTHRSRSACALARRLGGDAAPVAPVGTVAFENLADDVAVLRTERVRGKQRIKSATKERR